MSDPLDIVLKHALETLPDSLSARKRLLRAMSHVITEKHPAHQVITSQLAVIESLERIHAAEAMESKQRPR